MNRTQMIARVRERSDPWDIVVIGGGATGAGVAVDAATRGFSVLLVEREDFGKGTSSRSTKLIHGGVRYLEQGNVSLVMEALRERGRLFHNAPHLVHDLPFVVPTYSWWESPFYGIGLKVYDLLAGKFGFGKSRLLSRDETLEKLPTLQLEGLRGGIVYHDGQFDDTRLLLHLLATAVDHGAAVLNYASAVQLSKGPDNFLNGVIVEDRETSETFHIPARAVVNATGIFTDEVRRLDEPNAETMVSPSQGIHLVFDQSFLRGNTAIMVPHTADGRVMFAIPWHGHTLVGTTDTPIDRPSYEPRPLDDEIEFVLETAARYLIRPPTRDDILSIYVGIRPLVRVPGNNRTASLSREHTLHIDESGLLTIVGGKWTTYRHMAEDCVDHAITLGDLKETPCVTCDLRLHGYHQHPEALGSLGVYGSDAGRIQALIDAQPDLARALHPDLPYIAAEVVWVAREEMARTVEDILARRTRALFLNAKAAIAMAPEVAAILAAELNLDQAGARRQVEAFQALAAQYVSTVPSTPSRKG
jgi:glycerol-3-phosphate dehydrogenase